MEKQSHTMDVLFPLGVLALFAGAVITVLLMTAGVYQRNVERSAGSFDGPTTLAYVTEKLHRSDRAGAVSLGEISGNEALVLTEEYPTGTYVTYIYCHDGSLRELMVAQGLEVDAGMGRELIAMADFQLEEIGENLIALRCTDENQVTRDTLVALRSGEGG